MQFAIIRRVLNKIIKLTKPSHYGMTTLIKNTDKQTKRRKRSFNIQKIQI